MLKKYLTIVFSNSNNNLIDLGLLILRMSTSLLMICLHGWPKITSYLEGQDSFPELLGLGSTTGLLLAIFAEVICSILLIIGFFTRVTVIPLAVTMCVAAFIFNADQSILVKEKALIYLVIYICLLIAGSGKYSIDFLLQQKFIKN